MTTTMHRLQISLPESQLRYLASRAQRDSISMAEAIRRLLDAAAAEESPGSVAESAAIAEARPAYRVSPAPPPDEIVLRLPADLYQRLRHEAYRAGKPASSIAQEWLAERLAATPPPPEMDERARITEILRASGMLAELGPELSARADPTISLDAVTAALDRAGGKPLSRIILEQRGPKG